MAHERASVDEDKDSNDHRQESLDAPPDALRAGIFNRLAASDEFQHLDLACLVASLVDIAGSQLLVEIPKHVRAKVARHVVNIPVSFTSALVSVFLGMAVGVDHELIVAITLQDDHLEAVDIGGVVTQT
ncbi:MAG: hypothetical protein QM695_12525 [Micropruina sp.]